MAFTVALKNTEESVYLRFSMTHQMFGEHKMYYTLRIHGHTGTKGEVKTHTHNYSTIQVSHLMRCRSQGEDKPALTEGEEGRRQAGSTAFAVLTMVNRV